MGQKICVLVVGWSWYAYRWIALTLENIFKPYVIAIGPLEPALRQLEDEKISKTADFSCFPGWNSHFRPQSGGKSQCASQKCCRFFFDQSIDLIQSVSENLDHGEHFSYFIHPHKDCRTIFSAVWKPNLFCRKSNVFVTNTISVESL